MIESLYRRAEDVRNHLINFPDGFIDVKCTSDNIDLTKEIFEEVLGKKLLSKVSFVVI